MQLLMHLGTLVMTFCWLANSEQQTTTSRLKKRLWS